MPKQTHVKVVTLLKRKPGMSREAFIEYYERCHAVLATRVVPGLLDYRRIYLRPDRPAFGTDPPELDFDVITSLVFADMESYQRAFDTLLKPDVAKEIADDEEHLFDRTHITAYLVEEHVSDL